MNRRHDESGARSGRRIVALFFTLVALVLPLVGALPARADETPAPAATPLSVSLSRLTPAAIPAKGRIVLSGTVANDSDEAWLAINVHPFISTTPMTTRDELVAAAKSDPADEVGSRLYQPGQFVTIGDLQPGEEKSFQISLPVKGLPIDPAAQGVYWIGVHALGTNADGRDGSADGRARTFIPLVRDDRLSSVALVVPVRERVSRDAEGRVLGTTSWSETLERSGRLGRIGDFLASAGTHAVTPLLDPAVLDAVADLRDDNPAVSFGEAPTDEPTQTPTDGTSRSLDRLEPGDRFDAERWLDQLVATAKVHTTLGLGYADPDVASLARRRPSLLKLAGSLSAETFADYKIAAVPAVAPPDGWFADDLLSQVPPESMVLVSDQSAARTRTRWRTPEQQDLVFTDEQAESGGPGPTDPTSALAIRQRIISDAALRGAENNPTPMVVQLPDDWDPGDKWELADFFNQLDQPFVNLVSLSPASDATTPTFNAALGYPGTERQAEISSLNIAASRTLVSTTSVLEHLLLTENTVAHDLDGAALNAVSYHARAIDQTARERVLDTDARMRSLLDKVQVIGTDFVTLSGGSGTLAVTLVNGLEQPVTVGIDSRSSTGDVRIADAKAVKMAPGQRAVVRLKANASRIGVTQVVLTPVTKEGAALGTPLTFRLRTSQVGNLIWAVLGAGGLLLVVMIARRIRRGLREHRWRRA